MITEKSYTVGHGNGETVLERLLDERGESIDDFGSRDPGYSVWQINDMRKAAERIQKAVHDHESIIIFGDYDVDGMTASTIMKKGLEKLGASVDIRIPDRLSEGYGLNMNMVEEANRKGYGLAITVDNGIKANEEARHLDCDLIVTDHHELGDELPDAYAVMDCWREDNTYPNREICGAALAYKTMQAVYELEGRSGDEKFLLPYAAIGMIGDVMPLDNSENRAIVSEGLEELRGSREPGLRAIVEEALEHDPSSTDVAFYIVPMLNAASRMGKQSLALNALLAPTRTIADAYAHALAENNELRKDVSARIVDDASRKVLKGYDFSSHDPIIVSGDYHRGVIGIAAARLAETFRRPTVVVSTDGNVGSARSYGDINILEWIESTKDSLVAFGGHAGAAGLTVGDMKEFRKLSHEYATKNWSKDRAMHNGKIDIEISPSDITMETIEDIKRLEPFGNQNPAPTFIARGMDIDMMKRVGKKKGAEGAHLSVKMDGIKGIGFFIGDYADLLENERKADVVFSLEENTYNGRTTPQMMIQDIIYEPEVHVAERLPDAKDFTSLFSALKEIIEKEKVAVTTPDYIGAIIEHRCGKMPELKPMLKCLDEAGAIAFREMTDGSIVVSEPVRRQKMRISQTPEYRKMAERHRNVQHSR